jgi:hypothetical protein
MVVEMQGRSAVSAERTEIYDLATMFRTMLPGREVEANEDLAYEAFLKDLHSDPTTQCLPGGLGRREYKSTGGLAARMLTTTPTSFTSTSLPRCDHYVPHEGGASGYGACLGSCRQRGDYAGSCTGRKTEEKGGSIIAGFGGTTAGREDLVPTRYTLLHGGSCKVRDVKDESGKSFLTSTHVRTVCLVPPDRETDTEASAARHVDPMSEEAARQHDLLLEGIPCPRFVLPRASDQAYWLSYKHTTIGE